MGCEHSTTFKHPDLLVAFCSSPAANCLSQKWYRVSTSGVCAGTGYGFCGFSCGDTTDPGWVRNSPLRIELVDLLCVALNTMGGWPKHDNAFSRCFGRVFHGHVAPQLVEAFNKVCKKFNDAKLFDMGLQCRAITFRKAGKDENGNGGWESRLLVLVEKKSDDKLRDLGESLEHLRWLEGMQGGCLGYQFKSLLAWSPPEDWMTRLPPPYNETTKFAQPCQDLRELREKWIGDHGFTLGLELGL